MCKEHLPLGSALGSVSPCDCTCTEFFPAGMKKVTYINDSPGRVGALPPLGERCRGQLEPRVSHGSRTWPGERGGLPGTRPAFPFFTPSLPKSTRRRYRNQTFCCSGLLSCRLATAGSPGKLSAPHFPILCHLWTRRGGNTFPSPAGPLCNRLPPGSGAAPAREPLWPQLPLSPSARPPRTPRLSGSLFLPVPRG